MEIKQLKTGEWEYSFSFNGRTQKGTRPTQRDAQQAMREDLQFAHSFWRNDDERI